MIFMMNDSNVERL